MVERFSLSLASTGLAWTVLVWTLSPRQLGLGQAGSLVSSFPLGLVTAPSLDELPWDRPSKKDLNICVDEITRPSQFTSSSLGLRVLGPYLLSLDWALLAYWQKSSPKKSSCSTRFVCWCHKGWKRNCPIRCWSCGASLPYQWSLRLESESVKLLSAPLDSCVLGLATQSIASVKWLMFDWAFALQGLRNRLNHPCTSTR